jgi:hypothetical protein
MQTTDITSLNLRPTLCWLGHSKEPIHISESFLNLEAVSFTMMERHAVMTGDPLRMRPSIHGVELSATVEHLLHL